MCFSTPQMPELKPLPPAPTVNDEEIKRREAAERARLAASGGTAATVVSDLQPAQVQGAQKRVTLGV